MRFLLLVVLLAACARYKPCREDFRDPRPECNMPDPCDCEMPWADWLDACCRRIPVEALR